MLGHKNITLRCGTRGRQILQDPSQLTVDIEAPTTNGQHLTKREPPFPECPQRDTIGTSCLHAQQGTQSEETNRTNLQEDHPEKEISNRKEPRL